MTNATGGTGPVPVASFATGYKLPVGRRNHSHCPTLWMMPQRTANSGPFDLWIGGRRYAGAGPLSLRGVGNLADAPRNFVVCGLDNLSAMPEDSRAG